MKVLIIFLSLVGVSCVTTNTRDLSAINPETEPAESSPVSASPRKLASWNDCVEACLDDRLPNVDGCRADCKAKFNTEIDRKICIKWCKTIVNSCRRDCS